MVDKFMSIQVITLKMNPFLLTGFLQLAAVNFGSMLLFAVPASELPVLVNTVVVFVELERIHSAVVAGVVAPIRDWLWYCLFVDTILDTSFVVALWL